MTGARAEAHLGMDLRTISSDEWIELCRLCPEETAYVLVRLKSAPGDPVSPEQLDIDLELTARFPHSVDYYRERAEDSRWRRLDRKRRARELAKRVAVSSPLSAGVRP